MRPACSSPTREIAESYYLPLIYTACRTCYSELRPQDIFERATDGRVTPEKQQELVRRVIESGHGSHHRAHRLHVRHQRRHADALPPAGAPPGRPRLRPAVASATSSTRSPPTWCPAPSRMPTPTLRERFRDELQGSLAFYEELLEAGIPGEDARFVMPNATRTNLVMTDQPAGAHPHERAAPVHDGPVGDPAAVPAGPPRGLRR